MITRFIGMFYKLLDLLTENEQISRDVIQLCMSWVLISFSTKFQTRLINERCLFTEKEEGTSHICWVIHLIGGQWMNQFL